MVTELNEAEPNLAEAIRRRFVPLSGVDLELPPDEFVGPPPSFERWIVVDTNVLSELMRGEPHPAVLAWVAAQPRALLYTTHINQTEILYGIASAARGTPANSTGGCGRCDVR